MKQKQYWPSLDKSWVYFGLLLEILKTKRTCSIFVGRYFESKAWVRRMMQRLTIAASSWSFSTPRWWSASVASASRPRRIGFSNCFRKWAAVPRIPSLTKWTREKYSRSFWIGVPDSRHWWSRRSSGRRGSWSSGVVGVVEVGDLVDDEADANLRPAVRHSVCNNDFNPSLIWETVMSGWLTKAFEPLTRATDGRTLRFALRLMRAW